MVVQGAVLLTKVETLMTMIDQRAHEQREGVEALEATHRRADQVNTQVWIFESGRAGVNHKSRKPLQPR